MVDDELQPAGLSHESGLVLSQEMAALQTRRTRAARELAERGFRAEHFVPVAEGARKTWGMRFSMLEGIRSRLAKLDRSASGPRGTEVRWGDDGWWKWLTETVPGEQGLCIRLGSDRRFYVSEHQVEAIEDKGLGAFIAYGSGKRLLLEARLSRAVAERGRQANSTHDAKQHARHQDVAHDLASRVEQANSIRVPLDRWIRSVEEYGKSFPRRRPDCLATMFIAAKQDCSFEEAMAIAARLEALIGWENQEGRRPLRDIAPKALRRATMRDVVKAASSATLFAIGAGIRFKAEQIEYLVADLVAET